MSEDPGSNTWYGLGTENNDLDIDAIPESLVSGEGQSAGCHHTEPSSTTCSGENSGCNPIDQQDETFRGNEANLSAAYQEEQMMKRPNVSLNLGSDDSQTTKFTRQQSSQTEDRDHLKKSQYQIFLPPELMQQHFDILIIHAEEDERAAKNIKKIIEELYAKSFDGERTPLTVGLTEEVASHVRNNVDWLDHALFCCTYIFVIFTKHLMNDCVLSEMTKASLWATFSEEKKNKFCPVYLEKGAKEELKLSVYITVLSSLNMWKDPSSYKALIVQYIDVAPRIERCRRQDQEAKRYLETQKDTAAYSTSVDATDFSLKFHESQLFSAPNSQQPHFPDLSSASESGFSEETSPTTSTELASDNSSEHCSPTDFKSCPVKPEPCDENSMPAAMSKKQSSAVQELGTEVENTPQTSPDWYRYYLPMTVGAVIGVGLVYLFKK